MKKKPARNMANLPKQLKRTGCRRKYIEALNPLHATYPRCDLAKRSPSWYCDGHLVETRPMPAILALSNFSEYLLYRAKKRKLGEREAVEFFAATRRAMFFVLCHSSGPHTLRAKLTARLKTRISKLVELASRAYEAVSKKSSDVYLTPTVGS